MFVSFLIFSSVDLKVIAVKFTALGNFLFPKNADRVLHMKTGN